MSSRNSSKNSSDNPDSPMLDIRDRRVEQLLEFAFFGILLAYAGLMLTDIPSGNSGLFPRIVIPLVMVLLVYRLATIVLPFELHPRTLLSDEETARTTDEPGDDELETQDRLGSALDADLPSLQSLATVIGWILLGFLLAYVFGIPIGGFLYIVAFLYGAGDFGIPRSVGIAVLYTIMMYGLINVFEFRIWNGIIPL